jgi:hypothetical protein
MADTDRTYLSQYGTDTLGLIVTISGVKADPDDSVVNVTVQNEATGQIAASVGATRLETGTYTITLDSEQTSVAGNYTALWQYSINGSPVTYTTSSSSSVDRTRLTTRSRPT